MGIQGLLPLLKSIMSPIHIKDLEGCSVAVDTYSWLHKGAFSCSKELCTGQPTTKHISYCMHRVNLLRHHGIKPILVFDGGHLPMKSEQENKRSRSRKENFARAVEHESSGNRAAAYECYSKAVDITPSIAYELIQVLKQENIAYVVAPYEADAQMTFLAVSKQVDAVITEDSDLIPFGCPRIIYKMDKFGQGVEFQSTRLQQNKDLNFTGFTKQMFLEMCILSGCDYLQSLPGMGLKRAHALIKKFKSYDKVIKHLKYNTVAVPPVYEECFRKAILTFQHQRVYDLAKQDLVHLSEMSGNDGEDMDFLGPSISQHTAKGIATGDIDPFTKMPFQGKYVITAPMLDGTQPTNVKPESERKKIDLPVQKNLLTNYFCFASLEAKRKFRVPRVTPNHPDLRSEVHLQEDIDETASFYDRSCSHPVLTCSGEREIVDPTKDSVIDDFATKSSVSSRVTHGIDDRGEDLRSLQCSFINQSGHSMHPCMMVNKERQCNSVSDTSMSKTRVVQKNVTVRSSYFQKNCSKENGAETNASELVNDSDRTTGCESSTYEGEFKSAPYRSEGETTLDDSNPVCRSSSPQIKSVKPIDCDNTDRALLIKDASAYKQGSIIAMPDYKSAADDVQLKTRTESRKGIVRSSYFKQKAGKENDQDMKSNQVETVSTNTCENSILGVSSGNKYLEGTSIKRKFDNDVQTELLARKILRTNGSFSNQSSGTSGRKDMMDSKNGPEKFGCNISHIDQYSEIAEKSIEKFVSVISSFRYTSGSRASGLRAPLKDVRNTCINRLTSEAADLSKYAHVPTKRKTFSASHR